MPGSYAPISRQDRRCSRHPRPSRAAELHTAGRPPGYRGEGTPAWAADNGPLADRTDRDSVGAAADHDRHAAALHAKRAGKAAHRQKLHHHRPEPDPLNVSRETFTTNERIKNRTLPVGCFYALRRLFHMKQ